MEIVVYTLALIASIAALVMALLTYSFCKEKPAEKEEELSKEKAAELDKAVDVIKAYCKGQTEEGRCCFNLHEDNSECECILLKTVPEEWHDDQTK